MEDNSTHLLKVLEDPSSPLAEIADELDRCRDCPPQDGNAAAPGERALRVSLIRRILDDDPQFVQVARHFLGVDDFRDLLRRTVYTADSHGTLGGKGAALFVASRMLNRYAAENELLRSVKTPKTWHLTSDCFHAYIRQNDLDGVAEHKYKSDGQVRRDYPALIEAFKRGTFPPGIVAGLSAAIDDFADVPLIVRASSTLGRGRGPSFAGKYRSVFLSNQGSRAQRMQDLLAAVAEVYASAFGPDPLAYRMHWGLIDSCEAMGILIQEVAGTRIGTWYMPAFAGVAISRKEWPWSLRLRRAHSLLRLVPGLGTRAVARIQDDCPILISPDQPSQRINVDFAANVCCSPKRVDAINLDTGFFETVDISELLRRSGKAYPLIDRLASVLCEDRPAQPWDPAIDTDGDQCVITCEGLFKQTPFLEQISAILKALQKEFRVPVNVEFAHDGFDLHLLQCRLRKPAAALRPAEIPWEMPRDRVIFSANRFVADGAVSNITHLVYIDPRGYAALRSPADLEAVGQAIASLNHLLPKRRFLLIGPGRWGTRGDRRMGVDVTYSDINNAAMLVEISMAETECAPELSFGTHFFEDLMESSIGYLPLRPGEWGTVFRESFFAESRNWLRELLPEHANLADAIRVIDVGDASPGNVLHILMNGDAGEAVAFLAEAVAETDEIQTEDSDGRTPEADPDVHWRWRLQSVEQIAARLEPERFGIKALYLFGSTQTGMAGPQSDIDLLIHFGGTLEQEKDMMTWFDGWSLCLSYINYLKTGHKTDGLLSVHVITDLDIENGNSYAVKIGAATEPALFIPMGRRAGP